MIAVRRAALRGKKFLATNDRINEAAEPGGTLPSRVTPSDTADRSSLLGNRFTSQQLSGERPSIVSEAKVIPKLDAEACSSQRSRFIPVKPPTVPQAKLGFRLRRRPPAGDCGASFNPFRPS